MRFSTRAGSAVLLFAWLGAVGGAHAQDADSAANDEIVTAPLELDGTVLFRLRGVSSFPAETRARIVRDRIIEAAADPAVSVDAITAVEVEGVSRIVAGNRTLMTVLDGDATLEQLDRSELAGAHTLRIKQAITEYRNARTPEALRRDLMKALVAAAVLAGVIFGLAWYWRWIDRLMERRLQSHIPTVGIQSFEVMPADRIWSALRSALMLLRTLVFTVVILSFVGYILATLPWTRGLSQDIWAFVLAPLQVIGGGIVANIPSLIFLGVLFAVVRVTLRLVRLFFDSVAQGTVKLADFDPEWAQPTYKIVRVAIVAFALVVAYPYVPGSDSAAFKGVSLFIGIVFSLGSSSAISNMIAGYMLIYRRAFKVGDRVKIGDAVGEVLGTRLQVTHLRSIKNEELIIPNSEIISGQVCNYSSLARTRGLILHTEVGIGYDTPWRQVESMLIAAAERTNGLVTEPRPFVLEKALGEFAVTYELNAYCRDVTALNQLYAALHRNILDVFNEHGVQIMTPAYEGDPSEPKLVPPTHSFAAP